MDKEKTLDKVEKKEKTIEVSEAKLTTILDKIKRLESAASKAGLAKFDDGNRELIVPEYKIRSLFDNGKDKLILGWRTISNICEKNPTTGAWYEDQTMELVLDNDGEEEKIEMQYLTFVKRYSLIDTKFISKAEDRNKKLIYTLEVNGKEYKMAEEFLN
jgi:hypothetical protein